MTTTVQLPETDKDTINLFEVGCLVNLRVGTWSGRKMLTRQDMANVGIDPDGLPEDIVNLGRKLLVPKAEIHAITQPEQHARKYLAKWSVPFGIANSHFVPINILPSVDQKLADLKQEFFSQVDSFITRFSEMKAKIKDQHPEFWNKCLKNCYPTTPELLRAKFRFEWCTFKVAGLNAIQEADINELMASEQVKKERAGELRKQMSEFVGEYVTSMRAETVRFCELMSARVNGTPYGEQGEVKKLTPRSLSMFRKHIDKFKQMNVFGDTEIETMLNEFQDNFLDLGTASADFDSGHMKASVTQSLAAIRKKAEAESDNTSKFLGQLKRRVII